MRRNTRAAGFIAASAALLGGAIPRFGTKTPRQKEPLAATPEDERNLRQMYDALTAFGAPGFARGAATAGSIAWSLWRKVRHPGTPGSWRKRLRRLALLGWAKQTRTGLWALTAAGAKEVSR